MAEEYKAGADAGGSGGSEGGRTQSGRAGRSIGDAAGYGTVEPQQYIAIV